MEWTSPLRASVFTVSDCQRLFAPLSPPHGALLSGTELTASWTLSSRVACTSKGYLNSPTLTDLFPDHEANCSRVETMANIDPATMVDILRNEDPTRDASRYIDLPWFDPDRVDDAEAVSAYAVGGRLPGALSVATVSSWDWRHRIAVPLGEMKTYTYQHGQAVSLSDADVRERWARMAHVRFDTGTVHSVPDVGQYDLAELRDVNDAYFLERISLGACSSPCSCLGYFQ